MTAIGKQKIPICIVFKITVYCLLFYIAWTLALFAWRMDLIDPGSCEVLNWPGKGVLTSSQLQRYLALQLELQGR